MTPRRAPTTMTHIFRWTFCALRWFGKGHSLMRAIGRRVCISLSPFSQYFIDAPGDASRGWFYAEFIYIRPSAARKPRHVKIPYTVVLPDMKIWVLTCNGLCGNILLMLFHYRLFRVFYFAHEVMALLFWYAFEASLYALLSMQEILREHYYFVPPDINAYYHRRYGATRATPVWRWRALHALNTLARLASRIHVTPHAHNAAMPSRHRKQMAWWKLKSIAFTQQFLYRHV